MNKDQVPQNPSVKTAYGPVDNSMSPRGALRTVPYQAVKINGGFWANRQAVNRQVSLKHGYEMLEKAGNFRNLRIAAGWETGNYSGRNFYDEDIYKWLEALAWELGNAPDSELQRMADETISLIAAAQQPDGYLDSYYQVVEPNRKWTDLDHGHELYCAGHFFQAAVAFHRALGNDRLLDVACRLANHIDSVFGPGKKEGTCGHPEVEMALVELYRATRKQRYLGLAEFFIDQRGKRRMRGWGPYGPEYHQDHVPVREATAAAGHAVRQMYLNTGVADLYAETGEQALWDANQRLWQDINVSKTYITGGVGSRYDGESFGDPYELPPDQCYCETCAAIGSLMWNWRLLLLTGDHRYADAIERALYNGILSSPALDGQHFFYVNPLMLRSGADFRRSTNPPEATEVYLTGNPRPKWHEVACCPPNVMRLFASLAHYLTTTDARGIQIHQYAPAEIDLAFAPGRCAALQMETDYPWHGQVRIRVKASDGDPWRLSLRVPDWCPSASLTVNGEAVDGKTSEGYVVLDRAWKCGDLVELDLAIEPRLVAPHPRVDAVRGSLAIQRGPVVYCLEERDQEEGTRLLDITLDATQPLRSCWRADLLGGVIVVEAAGYRLDPEKWHGSLYQPLNSAPERLEKTPIRLVAVPYHTWGNRGLGGMRVWIPASG